MATAFDLLGALLLIILAIGGYKKGLIDGVFKIVGMYAAMYAAMNYSAYGEIILEPFVIISDAYKSIAGFATMFLVVMAGITFVAFLLRTIVKSLHLGSVDKIGGVILGTAKGGILLSAFVWAMDLVPEDYRGTWQQRSQLYPFAEVFADLVVEVAGLEDELNLMKATVGGFMGQSKAKLMEEALGGASGDLGISGADAMNLISGSGLGGMLDGGGDPTQSDVFKKAMGSLQGPQREIIEKAMEAMQTGNANSLLEGAIKSKDESGNSLMEDVMKNMNPEEKSNLHKTIMELEKEIKTRQNVNNE
ncbi:MAG: CvpA family protein [Candidatus Marinimicrobia bacterium]|nr:CvpA family protein [Candidatus Neomarinimicrobiota bacterium]MCF7850563.1 CvpA family protein [Candidatus Neomarinimicrobiota bacterium]MCF7903703.1 CvpA family protein [Candidatus Neomarinimicrobiota bacterium]